MSNSKIQAYLERFKLDYHRFKGCIDIQNGLIARTVIFDSPTPEEIRKSTIPTICLKSLNLILDSGKETYRVEHRENQDTGKIKVHLQTATRNERAFNEVKSQVVRITRQPRFQVRLTKNYRDDFAQEFLQADLVVFRDWDEIFVGDTIERYQREFPVRNLQVRYGEVPRYSLNRMLNLRDRLTIIK